ncbi:hypothetical protein HS961_19175 [Comamonas piscis]|uniref:Uncharacterized protein n=1 Tax=Comamonas piscis TaxID=1562974 RepID=A0A7G5ELB3_9BURK|nr:hypothetical protein [Comamonas piscis]QMV74788.1 hypothetical protein HS961_19175 [Comamonas piscis]WSO33258.1 hypothetical protein VUJ63_19235 [Comamonas piscis]
MKNTLCIQILRSAITASVMALSCTVGWAARDFTPQAGTWVVSSELDGKPGRGLAIDIQANTFFMQVFGYEKNGDATFYTATGQMDGNRVTAPLMRYKNGRSLGGAMQDAVEDKSVGQVAVQFSNGVAGTIQFPGEQALAIERFLVADNEPSVTNPRVQVGTRTLRLFTLDSQGDPSWTAPAKLWRSELGTTYLDWYVPMPTTGMLLPIRQFLCNVVAGKVRLHCTPNTGDAQDKLQSEAPSVESLELQFAGSDIHGVLRTTGENPQAVTVMGFDEGAILVEPTYREGITTFHPQQQQNYSTVSFGSGGACITGACSASVTSNTLMPMNGTWIVEDELTGKPGRGIALDIQGNTVILQLFNYRADGQPTFHMGSASYQSKGMGSRSTVATIPLRQYRGGRSLGGAAQSAQLEGDAGVAVLEFSAPHTNRETNLHLWWTQGQLQLPGEAPVKIRRLQIDAPENFAERMRGDWYVARTHSIARFDNVQGDGIATADGKIYCVPNRQSEYPNMSCGEPNGVMWNWHQFMYMPDMGRGQPFLRVRDRFGNSVGLGSLD